jgi:hypothetical protein
MHKQMTFINYHKQFKDSRCPGRTASERFFILASDGDLRLPEKYSAVPSALTLKCITIQGQSLIYTIRFIVDLSHIQSIFIL